MSGSRRNLIQEILDNIKTLINISAQYMHNLPSSCVKCIIELETGGRVGRK